MKKRVGYVAHILPETTESRLACSQQTTPSYLLHQHYQSTPAASGVSGVKAILGVWLWDKIFSLNNLLRPYMVTWQTKQWLNLVALCYPPSEILNMPLLAAIYHGWHPQILNLNVTMEVSYEIVCMWRHNTHILHQHQAKRTAQYTNLHEECWREVGILFWVRIRVGPRTTFTVWSCNIGRPTRHWFHGPAGCTQTQLM